VKRLPSRVSHRIAAYAAIGVCLSACSAEDPAAALTGLVQSAAAAAEARDTGHFRDLIAPSYTDVRGNDRDRLINLIRGYFLAHPSVEVIARLESAELLGSDAAELVVLAGVLGRRPGELLAGFDGRVYRLKLELALDDGDWQIIGARWERSLGASIGD
jgi:hypothetical protein